MTASSTQYEEFLPERRKRMADIIRVAFRQLGGEADAPPLTPPWFLPGAEIVWQHLYLGQLPSLLFAADIWQEARRHFSGAQDAKQRLQAAVSQIAPVRNEIAHVREVERDRLLRASVACADVLEMLQGSSSPSAKRRAEQKNPADVTE